MLRDPQFTELRHFKQREQHRQDLPGLGVTTDHIEPAGRAAHGEHRTVENRHALRTGERLGNLDDEFSRT